MAIGVSIVLVYAATFVAVGVAMWLLFGFLWYLGARIGRVTGVGGRVDRFLDTNGMELPAEERIKDDGGFRGGIGGP